MQIERQAPYIACGASRVRGALFFVSAIPVQRYAASRNSGSIEEAIINRIQSSEPSLWQAIDILKIKVEASF